MILYKGILIYFFIWVNSYDSTSRVYGASTILRRIVSLITLPDPPVLLVHSIAMPQPPAPAAADADMPRHAMI